MRSTMTALAGYQNKYQNVRFERRGGVLLMQLHTGGAELVNSGVAHTELVDAFQQVAADHDNHVVILTGTGSAFGDRIDGASFGDRGTADRELPRGELVAQVHYEGRRIMQAVLDVEAPMIAAINGPMTALPPFALTCDITLCSDDTTFSDRVHFADNQIVPGDGVQTVWQHLLGPNGGRYFLLTGQVLSAREALELRVVNEVLPRDRLLARAWELAEELDRRPPEVLRYSRLVLNHRYRRMILEDTPMGYGLQWLGIATATRG